MVQFKDIFLGIKQSKSNFGSLLVKNVLELAGKHNDLDNIGYTNRHHSFFEMLGNFSFGDYFKEEAIYAWEFLTKELNLDKNRLYVSVHKNDSDAKKIWLNKIKIKQDHLWLLDDADNFWQMGFTGPCGPCSEIYYDLGDELKGMIPSKGDPCDRYIEIWNLVFTQYDKDS